MAFYIGETEIGQIKVFTDGYKPPVKNQIEFNSCNRDSINGKISFGWPAEGNEEVVIKSSLSDTPTNLIIPDTISGLEEAKIAAGNIVFGMVGTFSSDATAVASDLKTGKTAYVNGVKITGTGGWEDLGTITGTGSSNFIIYFTIPESVTDRGNLTVDNFVCQLLGFNKTTNANAPVLTWTYDSSNYQLTCTSSVTLFANGTPSAKIVVLR